MKITAVASAIILGALLPATFAQADEKWRTDRGPVIYLEDVRGVAIFQHISQQGEIRYYIPDLPAYLYDRGVHHGYWISSASDRHCGNKVAGIDDFTGWNHGTLTIHFDDYELPTGWTMVEADCDGPPRRILIAQPVVGK